MKILRLEAWPVTLRLTHPYRIAYETIDATTNVYLRMIVDGGPVAYGCSAPDEVVTGETASSVLAAVEEVARPLLAGTNPLRRVALLERLQAALPDQPAALALFDCALHDLLGKVAGVPLFELLGGNQDAMRTSVTVGILPVKETVADALAWTRRGFRCLKLKGGVDPELDAERVMRVREAVGRDVELRFDANQGYSVSEAIGFVHATRHAKLELLEQPTPRNELALLGQVTNQVHIPVMADESLINSRDAFRITRDRLADMVNVKLIKVGGIHEALHINSVARSAHVEVMVGCMDESGLGIAAGLHYALSRSNVVYADLDGHLDLIEDPARDAVLLDSGVLRTTGRPGLGFDLPD